MVTTILALALGHSGLYGHVRIDPARPVCRVGGSCSSPAAGAVVAFTRSAHTFRAKADGSGYYRIALRPGRYAVRVERPRGVAPVRRFAVIVPAERYRRLDIAVDVGIR